VARVGQSKMVTWTSAAPITGAHARDIALFSGTSSPPQPLFTKYYTLSISSSSICMAGLISEVNKLSPVIYLVASTPSPSLCTPSPIDQDVLSQDSKGNSSCCPPPV